MDTLPIVEDSPSSSLYSMNYFEGIFCKKKKKNKHIRRGRKKGIGENLIKFRKICTIVLQMLNRRLFGNPGNYS